MTDHSMMSFPFKYTNRLEGQNIRLLRLAGKPGDEHVTFSLEEFSLDEAPPFQAISYAWGDATARKLAICNNTNISITESLYEALWQFQKEGCESWLWADAVCINQEDTDEKTTQVRIMARIYHTAYHVIIWLGLDSPEDEVALSTIHKLCANPEDYRSMSGSTCTALAQFLHKPWFWRAWVVQEYHMAKARTFRCGNLILEDATLLKLTKLWTEDVNFFTYMQVVGMQDGNLEPQSSPVGPFFAALALFRNADVSAIAGVKRLPLFRLLAYLRRLHAGDARDRVFSLVDIASDVPLNIVDYSARLEDVWHRLALDKVRLLADQNMRSDVFEYLCAINKSLDDGLPSWVPTYQQHTKWTMLSDIFEVDEPYTPNTSRPTVSAHCTNILYIHGRIVDQVSTIVEDDSHSDPYDASTIGSALSSVENLIGELHIIEDLVLQDGTNAYESQDLENVLFCSVGLDTLHNLENDPPINGTSRSKYRRFLTQMYLCRAGWKCLIQLQNEAGDDNLPLVSKQDIIDEFSRSGEDLRSLVPDIDTDGAIDEPFTEALLALSRTCPAEVQDYGQRLDAYAGGRRFFRSNKGYVGWIPRHSVNGDYICAFSGSKIPFVVRKVQAGFKLLGACFVHGLMDGEAADLDKILDVEDDMIKLI